MIVSYVSRSIEWTILQKGRKKIVEAAEEYSALIRSRRLYILKERDKVDMQQKQVIRDWSNISQTDAKNWDALDRKVSRLEREMVKIRQKDKLANGVLAEIYSHGP